MDLRLMYIFACSSYRTSFILPHRLFTVNNVTKYYPIFEKKIHFDILDRLISADCKSTGSKFECVCVTQNLNLLHRRYIRVNGSQANGTSQTVQPDFQLNEEIEYEMPTHGTLQKVCVLSRHIVIIYKEEKTLYTIVFEQWRKYSLQHLTLNFESDELLDCTVDTSVRPAVDKLIYLNSFKRVYSFNISTPMLKRNVRKENPSAGNKWFSLQDDSTLKEQITLRVKGINSTAVVTIPTSRFNVKTHWKAILVLLLSVVALVLSRVLASMWYFTKTKYEFLGSSILEYEENEAAYRKQMGMEASEYKEESAAYLSFIVEG